MVDTAGAATAVMAAIVGSVVVGDSIHQRQRQRRCRHGDAAIFTIIGMIHHEQFLLWRRVVVHMRCTATCVR